MRSRCFRLGVILGVCLGLCAPPCAGADDAGSVPTVVPEAAVRVSNSGTSKQYDKRLPPVLPGELVVTEEGERMRVWSSAGPVPVNPPPQPQPLAGNGALPGVIVDNRAPQPLPQLDRRAPAAEGTGGQPVGEILPVPAEGGTIEHE
jgi:hypothetical protein